MKKLVFYAFLGVAIYSCNSSAKVSGISAVATDTLKYADETHFKNIQQLTVGGLSER